ncbi:Protein kinase domain-containing protein [Aphelenchoides besseyi]|nr:Protein kinase domain-containing protein [Aphelenchoides besseyi]
MRWIGDETRLFRWLFFLVFCLNLPLLISSDVWCVSSSKYHIGPQILPEGAKCQPTNYATGIRRFPQSGDLAHCTRRILIDLSPDFVKPKEFEFFIAGLQSMMSDCFNEDVGYNIIVEPFRIGTAENTIKNSGPTGFTCCSWDNCKVFSDDMKPDDYLQPYPNNSLVIRDDSKFSKAYAKAWIDVFKDHNWQPCQYNSFIMITNRIIDLSAIDDPHTEDYFNSQCSGMCASLTVILVGREDATLDLLTEYYGNISKSLYVVPNVECLYKIGGCIYPCLSPSTNKCTNENLSHCIAPTQSPIATTFPATTTTEQFPDSLHVMYVYAFSTMVSLNQLDNIRDNLVAPIKTYKQTDPQKPLTTAFLVPSKKQTDWYTDTVNMQKWEFLPNDLLKIENRIDTSDPYTWRKIRAAIALYKNRRTTAAAQQAIIILLTDFVSVPFLNEYYNNGLKEQLSIFSFRIYAYDKEVHASFLDNHTVSGDNLVELDLNALKPIPLVNKIPDSTSQPTKNEMSQVQLVGLIVGCCALLLILLIVGTVIYRTKMSCWMDKIDRFRKKHQEAEPHPIIEDYWELSWDRLLIKSEKIGSGAYGQVFRGKVHGRPPCVDHFYTDRPHLIAQFENCDVAIKMLPKYATEAARKEFMNEIELMKTIGFNDNLVNMLGCITVGQSICLVLEYCPNRDLLQYVKALKVDVNISKSIDVKINYTKEFMLFAWQIADGMRFLASKHIIHRDLAARNILIDGQKNAKISDFGLCIILDENYAPMSTNKAFISASGRLPIKWLAVEALTRHEFSSKSDVWSYGILLWEMYSFGMTPFNEVPPKELAARLEEGLRPEKPMLCSDEMYDVMERCWQEEPEKRPNFQEILTKLTLFLERATEGYGYIQLITATEDYVNKIAMNKNGKPTENSNPNSPSILDKRTRVFSRTSSVSDTNRSPIKHRHNKGTANARIMKRSSRSSNRIFDLEKNAVDLEKGVEC